MQEHDNDFNVVVNLEEIEESSINSQKKNEESEAPKVEEKPKIKKKKKEI